MKSEALTVLDDLILFAANKNMNAPAKPKFVRAGQVALASDLAAAVDALKAVFVAVIEARNKLAAMQPQGGTK